MPPVKITVSMGNFSGRKWVLKKCTVKMKPTASSASSLWMVVATLIAQPGSTRVKNVGPPEHHSGSADHGHAPEHGEVIEFFPIGPAAVFRPRAFAHEPFDGAR